LPANDYNQQDAVIDGLGTGGQPTSAQKQASLRGANKASYPSTTPSKGVYLPYTSVAGVNTFTGGGILVEGDAAVKLSTSGASSQVYTITQGTTVTTITVNDSANTTTFSDNTGNSVTITGVPSSLSSSSPGPATMLYVDGNITALSGPGEGTTNSAGISTNPAIQNGTALTITALDNITITGDIRYATEPVTTTQNQISGTPADTLIPGNNNGQALGIFTANGNIQLNNLQGDGNLEIDASMAAISAGGSGGLTNTGNAINTLSIIGGRIQNTIQDINTTTRNVFFDRRYSSGIAPPWFPSTSMAHPGLDMPNGSVASFQRVQWVNQTSYQ
jgi:hypothetical protein